MFVTLAILGVAALMLLQGKFSLYEPEVLNDRSEEQLLDRPTADRDSVGEMIAKAPSPPSHQFVVPTIDLSKLDVTDTLKDKND